MDFFNCIVARNTVTLAQRELTQIILLPDGVAAGADLGFSGRRVTTLNGSPAVKLVEQDHRIGASVTHETGTPFGAFWRAGCVAGSRAPAAHGYMA